MWIGLYVHKSGLITHRDVWIDDTDFLYDNWAMANPNTFLLEDSCGKIDDDGDWEDDKCDSQYGFICKYGKFTGQVLQFLSAWALASNFKTVHIKL